MARSVNRRGVITTMQLPPSMVAALDARAASDMSSRSAIVRKAVRDYLDKTEEPEPERQEAHERAA